MCSWVRCRFVVYVAASLTSPEPVGLHSGGWAGVACGGSSRTESTFTIHILAVKDLSWKASAWSQTRSVAVPYVLCGGDMQMLARAFAELKCWHFT